MGEATPAQTAAGSFVPMLGVGLGAMQGGGGGGVGGSIGGSARGSAVPQLHNAIVERLRARIELCRRHHSTCESRYQRGQAESSEREHQSTLHLLNIVQQGPGTRKGKAAGGGRGSNLQNPVDYNGGRANGEQKIQEGEHKISTRIALQGSLRRKLEAHAPAHASKQNGLSCGFGGSDFKRVRLEAGALGHGSCNHNLPQSHPLQGSASSAAAAAAAAMGLQRKSYMIPHASGSDIFNMTLKEMKKEPVEIQSCGHSSADMIFDFKEEVGGQIDPDLQDLFDELTKTVPPLNDLEFEKMLKQDEAFGLDLGRPSSAGAAAGLCSPLDKPIKTEPSPDFGQVHCGSPQLRPASAGPSFTLTSTSSSSTSQKASSQTGHPRTLPCWPEISHAEQLKQMAANQQQPSALLHHHHHQTPAGGLTSWAPAINAHSSSSSPSSSAGAFPQDGVANSPLNQQRIGALSKGMNNCLFKPNGHNGAHHMDMKVLSTKPTLHFSPKAAAAAAAGLSASQPISILTRPDQQRQQQSPPPPPPPSGPNQPHPSLHFQNQQIPPSGGLCLPHKPVPAGLQFRMSQQRQAVPAAPRMTANGALMSQPRVSAPTNQQKGPPKAPSMQRPLPQQHAASNAISNAINNAISNAVSSADKDGSHEQFSRHLTRPPPDYKQSRSLVGVPQGMFPGAPSAPPPSNGLDGGLPSLSCQLRPGSVSKLPASPSERRFGSDCLPSSCGAPFQQQSGHARMGASPQSKPRFLGPPGKSFGLSGAQQHGPPLGAMMSNLGWGAANKQAGLRRLPNPLQSDAGHPYQNRPVAPPNQVAADLGMLPLRDAAPRPGPALLGSPSAAGTLNQASPEQRVPAGGNFSEPGSFQSGRANRLTFDFLPEGDNTVPGINADSDFIDSLLKSGSGNDDWMKDINLDEILGGHS